MKTRNTIIIALFAMLLIVTCITMVACNVSTATNEADSSTSD